MADKIFVVAPAGAVSGGPEVLHQLAHRLNREVERARMLYFPFGRAHQPPDAYARYDVAPARLSDVDAESIVVVPESNANHVKTFAGSRIYFWWLSVDFFFAHAGYSVRGRLLGRERNAMRQVSELRRSVALHLYQSEYARRFLESVSLGPSRPLSDYLAAEHLADVSLPASSGSREDILVFNPAKGARQTSRIVTALERSGRPVPLIVPLTGMSRDQVRDTLSRAKVYIDFGHHPGKDRIPREAAAAGLCVLVNRRGSAANDVDVPIPDDFKIDDSQPGFEHAAAERILRLMDDFDRQSARLADYRRVIVDEPRVFDDDVLAAFPPP